MEGNMKKRFVIGIIIAAILICAGIAVFFLINPFSNTLQYIDGFELSIPNEITTVYLQQEYKFIYVGSVDKAQIQELYDLRISRNEVSKDRSKDRDSTHSLMIINAYSKTPMISSFLPGVNIHFNEDFTQVWADTKIKSSCSWVTFLPMLP